jgi:membrane associated rhomboid family serine protease
MFIPLHDANSLKHIRLQYVTLAMIAINVVAFVVSSAGSEEFYEAAVVGLGYIPAIVNDTINPVPDPLIVPEEATYLSYAFLHGDWLHLGGNMLFLWVFGDNVEDALGHVKYLLFYLASAAAGAFAHGLFYPESDSPLIGASGAVAGVVAAYLILHPKVRIWVLAFGRIPLRIPAWIPLLLWVGSQFVLIVLMPDDVVSWAAHAGGIIAGAVLVLVLKRRGVPLFDQAIVTPDAVRTEPERSPIPTTSRASPAQAPTGRTVPRWGRQD